MRLHTDRRNCFLVRMHLILIAFWMILIAYLGRYAAYLYCWYKNNMVQDLTVSKCLYYKSSPATTVDIRIVYLHTDTDTYMHICILTADYTVKPVLSGHSKKKTNYSLMQIKSIAECSKGYWGKRSLFLIGSGAEIRSLEKGRKSPVRPPVSRY